MGRLGVRGSCTLRHFLRPNNFILRRGWQKGVCTEKYTAYYLRLLIIIFFAAYDFPGDRFKRGRRVRPTCQVSAVPVRNVSLSGFLRAASIAALSVSDGELRRLEVLRDVDRSGLPVHAAARLLERSERQVWRR